jgi:hypothetical protein
VCRHCSPLVAVCDTTMLQEQHVAAKQDCTVAAARGVYCCYSLCCAPEAGLVAAHDGGTTHAEDGVCNLHTARGTGVRSCKRWTNTKHASQETAAASFIAQSMSQAYVDALLLCANKEVLLFLSTCTRASGASMTPSSLRVCRALGMSARLQQRRPACLPCSPAASLGRSSTW